MESNGMESNRGSRMESSEVRVSGDRVESSGVEWNESSGWVRMSEVD